MNKKGLTLVEIILSIAILGIIAVAFLPILSFGYVNLFKTKDLTEAMYSSQQIVEKEMEEARKIDGGDMTKTVFGKSVTGHNLTVDIESAGGNVSGIINVFVPKYIVLYNVPIISSTSIKAYRNGTIIADADANYIFPVDSSLTFKGSQVDGSQTDFLMNVYRWYMSPVSIDPPDSYRDWIIVKEWNEARKPLPYSASYDFSFIPNIENDFDSLDFSRDFSLSNDEIANRFAGRYFVYSVTPYSLIGRVGVEKFSNAISTNKITRIDPILVSAKPGQYDIRTKYSTVKALMLNGILQDVNVTWVDPIINLLSTTQGEIVRTGTVSGYADPVEFHLTVDNTIPSIPTSLTIVPELRLQDDNRLIVPTLGSVETYYFNFTAKDKDNNTIDNELVTWQLVDSNGNDINPTGIVINQPTGTKTGILTIASDAEVLNFRVKATLVSNPTITAVYSVKTVKITTGTITTTITDFSGENSTNFTITLYDNQGIPINGLRLTNSNISVTRVYTNGNSTSYKTLQELDDFSNVNVSPILNNSGNGIYTWSVYGSAFNYNNTKGIRVKVLYTSNISVSINSTVNQKYQYH